MALEGGEVNAGNVVTTSTRKNYLISPKTSLFFSFYIASCSFILSLSHYSASFYTCSLEFLPFIFLII